MYYIEIRTCIFCAGIFVRIIKYTSFFTYLTVKQNNTVLELTTKIKSEKIFFIFNDLVTSK